MPNGYNSLYTGSHNDEYETRIALLEDTIIQLQDQIDLINENFNNYLPLTGGTLSGPLTLDNGSDLRLKARSATNTLDSGDIVFTDGNGTEKGRIWTSSSASAQLSYRPKETAAGGSIFKILTGRVSISNGSASVTFSSPFGAAPTVVTSPHGTGTNDFSTHTGNTTTTGCTIYGTSQSGSGSVTQGSFPVNWIAIGTWP